MHISNFGFNARTRKIEEQVPGQEVDHELRSESKVDSGTKHVSVVGPERSQITKKNYLSRDIEIKGSITVAEELFLDGKVDGEINARGALTVGANAEILGQIRANSAKIFGKIVGKITADEYCELKAQSVLEGDLKASRLVMEDGASFVGNSEILPSRVVVKLPQLTSPVENEKPDQPANS